MKIITLFVFTIFALICSMSVAQTTFFYGKDPVLSSDGTHTGALYSVKIDGTYVEVTVELVPRQNLKRLTFYSSETTLVTISSYLGGIIGFKVGDKITKEPCYTTRWGWDNVKAGERYYYTMVFKDLDGLQVPPGGTDFTLADLSKDKRGFCFKNYTLINPHVGMTLWTELSVKEFADKNNDGICGIYEGDDDSSLELGCVKENGQYRLIYLGGTYKRTAWWAGDIKATLRPSTTVGFFKAEWVQEDKSVEKDCYVSFDGASMNIVVGSEETFYLKMYPTSYSTIEKSVSESTNWSGTGFALKDGYIVTNNHVVDGAKSIKVQGIRGSFNIEYSADIVATDKNNDLAIIKINDSRFNGFGAIPYRVKTSVSEVGEDIFVLGYPLTSTMGDEIKLTTGVISSRTGFQGDVSLYQISAPIQPGNSGGPLFDGNGNIIGIVNAKHTEAENVGYAIKTSYLNNLVESTTSVSLLPTTNSISTMNLSNKVKSVKNFVFMIRCSNVEDRNSTNK